MIIDLLTSRRIIGSTTKEVFIRMISGEMGCCC